MRAIQVLGGIVVLGVIVAAPLAAQTDLIHSRARQVAPASRYELRSYSGRVLAVQACIDAVASDPVTDTCIVPADFHRDFGDGGGYDASAVRWNHAKVRMVREGRWGEVFDVEAYGGDGGDTTRAETAALQAAIDAANAFGAGRVEVPVGTFVVDAAVDLKAGVSVYGVSPDSSRILVQDSLGLPSRDGIFTGRSGCERIEVADLSFEDRTNDNRLLSFIECSHITVRGNHFSNESAPDGISHVLTLFHASSVSANFRNFLVTDNFFETARGTLLVQGAGGGWLEDIRVIGNVISGDSVAVAADGQLKIDKKLRHVIVADNLIDGGGVASHVLQVEEGVEDIIVRNNIVRNAVDHGIHIGAGQTDQACENVSVLGNQVLNVTGGQGHGIVIDSGADTGKQYLISDNVFRNLDGYFVWDNSVGLDQVVIKGNSVVEYGGPFAVQVRSNNMVIRGNTLETASDVGFVQALSGSAWVTGNRVNRTGGTTSGQYSGARFLTILRNNGTGVETFNRGSATIPAGSTVTSVAHGLPNPPSPDSRHISVTPTNDLGHASQFWISNVGPSTFDINVDADPGDRGASFVWQVEVP